MIVQLALLMVEFSYKKYRLWMVLFILFPLSSLYAQVATPDQERKAAVTKKVYQNIVNAIGDARQAPVLIFAHNKTEIENYTTYYSPKRHTIIIGEGIYNIAVTFGSDSLNALAFVVGHELAHYYKDHGWGMAFGSSAEDLKIAQEIYESELSIDRKKIMEAEADYFGGLYGYLAGYNTLKVGAKFIAAFYDIGVPETVPGYPDKEDRQKIVSETTTDLAQLITVYEAANLLSIVGNYEESARCYQHIATSFPSREIYNNAGVNLATHALSLFKKEERDYFYPFGLDENTRLNQGGTKGGDPLTIRKELFNEAITAFEKAIHLDKSYIPAYINVAMTYDLIGDKEMADLMALKALRMAKESKDTILLANALIAKGIIKAHGDNKKEAKLAFDKALSGNNRIATLNLSVLKNGKPYQDLINKKEKNEILTNDKESINEVDPSLMEVLLEDAEMVQLKSQNKERPKVKIYSYNKDGIKAIHVKHYTRPIHEKTFIVTPEPYEEISSRGIKLNDEMAKVLKVYGTPSKISSSTKGNYFIYEQTRIIFKTNQQDKISQWILY